MGATEAASEALGSVVHIIQVSLTPVFLLSGIATLLNVFSTRLARVADQDHGAAVRNSAHIGLDCSLALIIQCRSRLVEDQDPRVCHQRLRYGNALSLTS